MLLYVSSLQSPYSLLFICSDFFMNLTTCIILFFNTHSFFVRWYTADNRSISLSIITKKYLKKQGFLMISNLKYAMVEEIEKRRRMILTISRRFSPNPLRLYISTILKFNSTPSKQKNAIV